MLGINSYRKLKKHNKIDQSYLYISNTILSIVKDKGINIIGLTSSFIDKESKDIICESICKCMCKRLNKVCLISTYIDIDTDNKNHSLNEETVGNLKKIKAQNISVNELEELIDKEKNNAIVIINFPPINIFSEALEYSKIFKNIILIEKYCYSRYDEFENTLDILKQNDIQVLGIITYV